MCGANIRVGHICPSMSKRLSRLEAPVYRNRTRPVQRGTASSAPTKAKLNHYPFFHLSSEFFQASEIIHRDRIRLYSGIFWTPGERSGEPSAPFSAGRSDEMFYGGSCTAVLQSTKVSFESLWRADDAPNAARTAHRMSRRLPGLIISAADC